MDTRSNGQTVVNAGSKLIIQRGATLLVRDGGTLTIYGEVIVEAGGYVCFERYANVNVYAGGKLTLDPAALQGDNPIWGPLQSCAGPPIPATSCATPYVSLRQSATNACIGSTVEITATPGNGAILTNWRVENGTESYRSGNTLSVWVNSRGTTTVYADYKAASGCSGGGTAKVYIYVVDQQNGLSCPQQITMYPNPSNSYVQFTATAPEAAPATFGTGSKDTYKTFKVELYDSRGKKTKYKDTTSGELRLDTSDLPVGLYHVTITQGKTVLQKNLSIER